MDSSLCLRRKCVFPKAQRQFGWQVAAFSLVEIVAAMGIAVFCLVALFTLLPMGLNSNHTAIEQTVAAGIARSIVTDLRATGTNTTSPSYGVPLNSGLETLFFSEDGSTTTANGSPAASGAFPSQYRASLYFTPMAEQGITMVRVLITWPALADPSPMIDPRNYAGSYEVLTALDRH
jgi:type II secretory pathway pseudopilin PulG